MTVLQFVSRTSQSQPGEVPEDERYLWQTERGTCTATEKRELVEWIYIIGECPKNPPIVWHVWLVKSLLLHSSCPCAKLLGQHS